MSDKNKQAGTPAQLPRVPEWADWLLSIGLLCILVGMTLPLFHHNAIYFFSAGVLLQLVGRAASLPAIYISAGVRGLQLKIAPAELIAFVGATVAEISRRE